MNFYAYVIDSIDHLPGFLESIENRCPNLPQLLETKVRTAINSRKTARSILMMDADVEVAAAINKKGISSVTDKLQELFFCEERRNKSTKGMVGVNA